MTIFYVIKQDLAQSVIASFETFTLPTAEASGYLVVATDRTPFDTAATDMTTKLRMLREMFVDLQRQRLDFKNDYGKLLALLHNLGYVEFVSVLAVQVVNVIKIQLLPLLDDNLAKCSSLITSKILFDNLGSIRFMVLFLWIHT